MLEDNKIYKFHKDKGFPKLPDNTQCSILLSYDYSIIQNLFPEIKNEPFPLGLIKEYITVDRSTFAEYFRQSDFIENNIKQYLGNPYSDGTWVRKVNDKYELVFQERGSIFKNETFDNKNELEEYLITMLHKQFG